MTRGETTSTSNTVRHIRQSKNYKGYEQSKKKQINDNTKPAKGPLYAHKESP